ncbi:MAG: response regulator [Polyangiaceae bacterium]
MSGGLAGSVLVVDDERLVAREIAEDLLDLGYDVPATASTADEALSLAREKKPDLVLLDVRIRGPRDGIEAASILRDRLGIPVVFMTACSDVETLTRAKATDPYAYLLKPVSPSELRSTVEIALNRARVERALNEQRRWLAITLRAIADGVISVDNQGLVTFLNPTAEALTGWKLEDARGMPWEDVVVLLDEDNHATRRGPLAEALHRRAQATLAEGTLLRSQDGRLHAIEDSAAPIMGENGDLVGAVMVFQDVTEKRQLKQQAELNDRLAALGTLAAGVAHEVNNPLSYIIGNQLFAQGELAEIDQQLSQLAPEIAGPIREKLGVVGAALRDASSGAERVRSIMVDLKMLGRPNPARHRSIDLRTLLDGALKMTLTRVTERARVVREFGECPMVRGDEVRLTQVFVNLLINAAHAIPAGKPDSNEVRIVTRTSARGTAEVEIRDTGSGISKEMIPRIFEPFFTTRGLETGTGLGLSISHGIISSLGGTIEVDSRVGAGSSFRVLLPAATGISSVPPPIPRPSIISGRHRLLFIDDERILLDALGRALETRYEVDRAASAANALSLFEQGREYDLIVCDLMMPNMTGMELFRTLQTRFPEHAQRTVFMTGGAFAQGAQEFLSATRRRMLEKPFSNEQLVDFVRSCLEHVREH